MTTDKRAAENLFRAQQPEKASDAEKLQDVRKRLQQRQREQRQDERRQRAITRSTLAVSS